MSMQRNRLPAGWELKKLGEAFQLKPSKDEVKRKLSDKEEVSFLPMEDLGIQTKEATATKQRVVKEVINSYTYFADNDVLLAKITPCFENGKLGIARNLKNGVGFGSSEYIVFRSTQEVVPEYLYYFLSQEKFREEGKGKMTGAVGHKRVSKEFIENYLLPFPQSISEQKRIVAILDEAFAAIDKAKANLEKNLQNAKELFETYLEKVFANGGEGWEEKKLSTITEVKDGTHDSPKYITKGIPFVTQKNIRENGLTLVDTKFITTTDHDKFYKRSNVSYGDILISMIGANRGMACVVDDRATFSIKNVGLVKRIDAINQDYLLYFLKSPMAKEYVKQSSNGGAQEFVGLTALRNFPILVAPRQEQDDIVNHLNSLATESKRLQFVYQQKLTALAELKKSILQKAFAGELTASQSKMYPVPPMAKVVSLSPTDTHAAIISLALRKHNEANRAQTFGHVKSEKIVNMVQYMFDLELARQPVKEPAGPNDFPRLKAVESRAKLAGFFYVNKRGGGYDYTLGTKASSLIEKLEKDLGADYEALVNFIGLMIPLDTKEAEVRATVYSSWNNLLLDGATITDEAIVYEAREAWHPDKLKIPREKFFEAIEWIKANDIVPKGNGKKVEHKTTKPNQKK